MSDFTAKPSSNYTEDMISMMEEMYTNAPSRATAEALAAEFDKPVRSVIAKLSSMGIYKAEARVTKQGTPVVRKEELVAEIQASVGVEVPTLAKATKADLQALLSALSVVAVQ